MTKLRRRRLKNKILNNKIKVILILFFVFVFFLGSAYALYNTTLSISGSATIKEKSECKYNVTGSFEVTNSWWDGTKNNYDISLTITNNSNEDIIDWTLDLEGPSDVAFGWINASYTIDNGSIVITPKGYEYQRIIRANSKFVLNFNVSTVEENIDFNSIIFNGCILYGTENTDVSLKSLVIKPNEINIMTGEISILSVQKIPSYKDVNVTWTSSDSSIAIVDSNGTVTGISAGRVTILATVEGITSQAIVNVSEKVLALESIEIVPSSYRMSVGEEVPLQIETTPTNVSAKITWTSSDPSVATVNSNGRVVAVSNGNAIITASSENLTSTCAITVRDIFSSSDVRVTHEKINGGYRSGPTFQFKVTIENLTNEDIEYFKIAFHVPNDVEWSNWQPHLMTFSENNHELIYNSSGYNKLKANSTYTYNGSITFPEKYLIDGYDEWNNPVKLIPNEYLQFEVTNIILE